MSDNFRKSKSLFSTTLSVGIGTGTSETITLSSTVGLPTDAEITLTIDRVDSGGNPSPSKVERITGTVSGSNIVSYARGMDSTSDQAHSAGAVVEYIWNGADWNDAVDGILQEHNDDGTHKSGALDSMVSGTEQEGDIMYRNSTQWARLGVGDAGDHLRINAGEDAPEWTKKLPRGSVTSVASSATHTIDVDTYDTYIVTAQAAAVTFGAPTGTPLNNQKLIIRIKDDGTARAITWNSIFRASSDLALPTTTILGKTMYCGFVYNEESIKWDLIAYLDNF